MQTVSQGWKNNQKQNFVSESFVEIKLNISDPDAQDAATASDNGHIKMSNTAQTVDETEKAPTAYAVLERNSWFLNGTRIIAPATGPYGDEGYIGDLLSDENGLFEVPPTLTISFDRVFDTLLPGITIEWGEAYDEWASEFRITAYNGTEIVSQELHTSDSVQSMVEQDMQEYDRITIEVLRWSLPYHRARIKNINLGTVQTWTKSDFFSYSHTINVDPLSLSLPKAEIRFSIKNLNGEYNPDNPQGAARYLLERQRISGRYGYKIGDAVEWIDSGTFFTSEWTLPQNGITMEFVARDSLEYMNDLYTGPSSGTLATIITAAMNQAGLPLMSDGSVRWVLGTDLASITVPSGLDLSEYTIAEVIQLAANAGCCAFWQDRQGRLHVEKVPDGLTDYKIDRFVSYSNADVTLRKALKSVNVNNGQYVLNVGAIGEEQNITNPLISDSQAPIVAAWIANYLKQRKTLNGEFRADPRLDALDRITNQNQFAETIALVTEIEYSYNGAFRGRYEGVAEE